MTLSGTLSNYYEYNLVQHKNSYHQNPVYSDAFTNDLKFCTDEFIGYMMYPATSTTLPISEFEYYTEEEAE